MIKDPLTQALWEGCLYELCISRERLKTCLIQKYSIVA